MNPNDSPVLPSDAGEAFCVKGLAEALGVSATYVYQMRACGFVMNGVRRSGQTATVKAATEWIQRTGFRMVNGRGCAGEASNIRATEKTG